MEYHVIAVDAAKVPRIVFSDPSPRLCQARAEVFWDTEAGEGEVVFVGSDECRTVKLVKESGNN